jgi:sugar phosphate isomerase/epimerase
MDHLLPLRRVRVEVERTLRTRPFFACAIRGALPNEAYVELLTQVGALVSAVSMKEATDMLELAGRDCLELSPSRRERSPSPAILAANRIFDADEAWFELAGKVPADVGLLVLGTSWTRDVNKHLSRHLGRRRSFLGELAERSAESLQALEASRSTWVSRSQDVYAFAELTRGALLGVATYLESTWQVRPFLGPTRRIEPAPVG